MAAENRDFGRFVTTWYNVHCKHTRFFEFLGLLNEGFWKKLGFGGLGLGFGVVGSRRCACQRTDIYHTAILLKKRFPTNDCSESKTARDLSFSGSVHMPVTTEF